MTLNDIAYWYYMGLGVQVIYVVILFFLRKTGDTDTRLQKMRAFAEQEDIPLSVFYVMIAIMCLFWPYFLTSKILRLLGLKSKKVS
ncbi:hypothetical protein D3C75_343320 [compost metagenome]